MADQELPAVAKSIFVACKKCGEDRYHTVITHTSSTSAKLKCEVCGASRTYKLGVADKPAKAPKAPKGPGVRAQKEAAAKQARVTQHQQEYDRLVAENEQSPRKYSMKEKFSVNDKVDHPKFGLGVIRLSLGEKIEVVFSDEVRHLVHNRS